VKVLIAITILFVGALIVLQNTLGQNPDRRNYEFAPDMAESFAYKAQSENPFLPNGQTSQPPVPGTVARGQMPLHFGTSESEAVRAGEELRSPFNAENPADLKRGQQVYEVYCLPCHGAGGRGDGPVAQRGYPPPPPLQLDRARAMKDGQIFHIITYGFRNMPAYGPQIERHDRWQVIEYVRKLQASQP